jgi:hypothetical protein
MERRKERTNSHRAIVKEKKMKETDCHRNGMKGFAVPRWKRTVLATGAALCALLMLVSPVCAEESEEDLAKMTQNPVSDLISVPFQNNWNFDVGPRDKTQYILNIQPVWPFSLNQDWNLITRTIVPVISQPSFAPGMDRENGLGDINFTAFFSPAKPSKLIWGMGPTFLLPTATDDVLGTDKWGAGPAAVALTMQGPWVYGALANNIWSFAGTDKRDDVNAFLLQPFVNYNLPDGWYLSSAPVVTANWEADSDNTWTVPVGGGVGKIIKIGKLPLNCSLRAYYNVEKPDFGADWQLQFQVQFLFPK